MDIINKTGIPTKNKGDGLSSTDFNKINGTVNQNVDANNLYLKSMFDVNLELGTGRQYTLGEVISLVPVSRRRPGFLVRFLNTSNFYEELTFTGESIDVWNDLDKWGPEGGIKIRIIDGGEY